MLREKSGTILTVMSQQRLWDICSQRISFLEHDGVVLPMGPLSSRA